MARRGAPGNCAIRRTDLAPLKAGGRLMDKLSVMKIKFLGLGVAGQASRRLPKAGPLAARAAALLAEGRRG